LRSFSVKK